MCKVAGFNNSDFLTILPAEKENTRPEDVWCDVALAHEERKRVTPEDSCVVPLYCPQESRASLANRSKKSVSAKGRGVLV